MNTHPNPVNHNLPVGTFEKNLRARQQEIYLNQLEARWVVDHQPRESRQAGWMNVLYKFFAIIRRAVRKPGQTFLRRYVSS